MAFSDALGWSVSRTTAVAIILSFITSQLRLCRLWQLFLATQTLWSPAFFPLPFLHQLRGVKEFLR